VHLCVRRVLTFCQNITHLHNFFTIGQPHHSSFSVPNVMAYSDGNPLTGASNASWVGRNRDSEPLSGFTACCEAFQRQVHLTVTDHGEFLTLVAGKRLSLLMAGNNDEVYDKKPQRYAVINVKPK